VSNPSDQSCAEILFAFTPNEHIARISTCETIVNCERCVPSAVA
jgi:hypothetical protein